MKREPFIPGIYPGLFMNSPKTLQSGSGEKSRGLIFRFRLKSPAKARKVKSDFFEFFRDSDRPVHPGMAGFEKTFRPGGAIYNGTAPSARAA